MYLGRLVEVADKDAYIKASAPLYPGAAVDIPIPDPDIKRERIC